MSIYLPIYVCLISQFIFFISIHLELVCYRKTDYLTTQILSIDLSIFLSIYLSICLSVLYFYLTISSNELLTWWTEGGSDYIRDKVIWEEVVYRDASEHYLFIGESCCKTFSSSWSGSWASSPAPTSVWLTFSSTSSRAAGNEDHLQLCQQHYYEHHQVHLKERRWEEEPLQLYQHFPVVLQLWSLELIMWSILSTTSSLTFPSCSPATS